MYISSSCPKYHGHSKNYICVGGSGYGLTDGDSGGGAFVEKSGKVYLVDIATKNGVLAKSPTNQAFLDRNKNPDALLKITNKVCAEIKKASNATIECAKSVSAPSEECIQRLEEAQEAQSKLSEYVKEGNQQNVQEVWSGGKIEDPDL
uniref:Uncharacterized protein n=1 Tax=Panagrolaimus davidi TaxID=227884 RepID=A0A914Q1X0_9BILA